ncbi:MAG: CCA tRNA nucleotidyltransferase [Desulfurococcaceae archaeon]
MSCNECDEIEAEVLRRIRPSESEYALMRRVFEAVKGTLEEELRARGISVEVTLQGSVAHDTWLSGDRDLDVFVLFPKDWGLRELKNEGFKIVAEAAQKLGRLELRYAEHPYVRVQVEDVEVDIVPALKADAPTEARSAVDRTPFHTRFLNERLTQEMRDQARLLKKFMKAIGVYGAEVKVRGFSGYAAELLIVRYGSFRNVLANASSWKPPVFVDVVGLGRPALIALTRRYPDSVMFMPDPVDPNRNVAAAVSMESLAKFSFASACYLKNPSMAFFEPPRVAPPTTENLAKALEGRCILFVEFSVDPELPPEVVWGELNRVADRAAKLLAENDFLVLSSSTWTNEKGFAAVLIELASCEAPSTKFYEGPPFYEVERALDFVSKHVSRGGRVWIGSDGRLLAIRRRAFNDALKLLAERHKQFVVAPHFKGANMKIAALNEESVRKLLTLGAFDWLAEFVMRTPPWMLSCTG